jgi:hypothetical protein
VGKNTELPIVRAGDIKFHCVLKGEIRGSQTVGRAPPRGALLVLWGSFCMRDIIILNEIWAQDKTYIFFDRHIAWLKYFTRHLVPVLAPNCKQHILSPSKRYKSVLFIG